MSTGTRLLFKVQTDSETIEHGMWNADRKLTRFGVGRVCRFK